MEYDLTIIGAGWAGVHAALTAKELGLKVCIIEKSQIGGTCLNLGCIPTKALIQSAKIYSITKKSHNFGIETQAPTINFTKIQERKDKVVDQLRSSLQFIARGIDIINAEARIISNHEIAAGNQTINTKFIIIASGSKPLELGALKFDGKKILSSNEILTLKNIPKSLLIVGGGVIGCEFASLFQTLGSLVSIVEKMPQLLPGMDKEVAKKLETIFKKKGIKISTGTDAASVDLNNYELVLVSIGRTANTQSLLLDKLGVKTEKNKIVVDEYLKTSIDNIYAAGDCTGKIMLAHFAEYQGSIAAGNIASPNDPKKADNSIIPNCIFTDPEIACVGLSEEEAKERGIELRISKFDFIGSGMARILDESEGFIKIISDHEKKLIGASIIGAKATELIGILSLAISNHLTFSQIRDTIFAHPTLSESIIEVINK